MGWHGQSLLTQGTKCVRWRGALREAMQHTALHSLPQEERRFEKGFSSRFVLGKPRLNGTPF